MKEIISTVREKEAYAFNENPLFGWNQLITLNIVDTTTPQGIDRAISMGLLRDGNALPEIIFSPYLHESSNLFKDTSYQGRIFCVFRHPIERAVSLFYYLKKASWEPTFSVQLEQIESIEDYAISEFAGMFL